MRGPGDNAAMSSLFVFRSILAMVFGLRGMPQNMQTTVSDLHGEESPQKGPYPQASAAGRIKGQSSAKIIHKELKWRGAGLAQSLLVRVCLMEGRGATRAPGISF